jgi:uncharacterized membrane protein YphA (DoxX/SURF4 family)
MMEKKSSFNWAKLLITALRMAIGWHFLYEGVSKLILKDWSSYSYLINATGPLSGLYHWLAATQGILKIVDILNIYGLILIGLALFIGLFSNYAAIAGTFLLVLYYFAYPPFGNSLFYIGEGHLFIVDNIFIEGMALMFFVFLKEKGYGIGSLVDLSKSIKIRSDSKKKEEIQYSNSRREVLKNISVIPLLGLMGWGALIKNKKTDVDVMSGATIQLNKLALGELKGALPKGKLGKHEISRLVLGSNLMGGFAHSRDLIYVPGLFKAYNTEKKIYETLILAEKAGINAINIDFGSNALMAKYKRMTGSNIKVISQVGPNMEKNDYYEYINKAIDFGADIIQIQGNWCDWLVRDNKIDVVSNMLDKIRSQKIIAGLAAHSVESLIICEENGIIPDYFMKTMHHDQYWSAHPREKRFPFEVDGDVYLDHNRFHDNMFCLFPEKTVEFVKRARIPVMGYKVLAAGAIKPDNGFKWAFEKGADFICVGMFDFQIVEDVNICTETLARLNNRERAWYG